MDKNHLIAGSLAGCMEHTLMYPFDAIKTRVQTNYNNNIYFKLWRGISIIGFATIPAHALYFGSYEYSKKIIIKDDNNYNFIKNALCGILPTVLHDSIMVPFDVCKQRMQINPNNNFKNQVKNILKKEGFFAFYKSLPITLFTNIPSTTSFISINENFKIFLKNRKKKLERSDIILSSFVAGSMSAIITQPLDIIKTKLQTQYDNQYLNIKDTTRKIFNSKGISGFYVGTIPRICYLAPSSTISWFFYEEFIN